MKLTILTINYNNVEGLKRTIDSVTRQTWTDYDWIVIDGGSTDGSKELIEANQSLFSYWCSEPDKGVYNAMNKGISHASGEYICCMNSGDAFYACDTLEKVFKAERHEDIVYGDWLAVFSDREEVFHEPFPIDFHYFMHQNICHQAMFVRTENLKKKGFDESYKLLADYARWTEMLLANCSVAFVDTIMCRYEMDGMSCKLSNIAQSEHQRIREELIPSCIYPILNKLDKYRANKTYGRLEKILDKGGVISRLARGGIKILCKMQA